ncbi:Intraflagellar transport protein 88 [Coelomomyces lativittatus]|nr:Intraflagellar transport protein 88 [Coelomomyces lativittatus]
MTSTLPGAFPTTTSSRAGVRSQWGSVLQSASGNRTSSGADKQARPMTSNRAAGFSSRGRPTTAGLATFDPFKVPSQGQVDPASELTPEEQVREIEKSIFQLLHESAMSTYHGQEAIGLAKAKEAGKRERQLLKQRETLDLMDQVNLDLTYCVLVNLAHQYAMNGMPQEAINTYTAIVKNKTFCHSGRLRVNIGNLYFGMKKFPQAIKMYRMALDQISQANRELRFKILRNMGSAFVCSGQFQDAVMSYETIMETQPDHSAAFHLLLCYYALGEKDKIRMTFQRLVSIPLPMWEPNDHGTGGSCSSSQDDMYLVPEDPLKFLAITRQKHLERFFLLLAQLIAPTLDVGDENGFDTLIEMTKTSPCADLTRDLEMTKANMYLHHRDFQRAIDAFKTLQKKGASLSMASTNLAFLYFYQGEMDEAKTYATRAIEEDRYNAKAHCNLGNVFYKEKDYDRAKDLYLEAINIDALCTEAIYNLGLVYKDQGYFEDALKIFEKLHSMLRNSPENMWHIADLYEKMGNMPQALETYSMLASLVPTDPKVLAKLGELYARDGDMAQGFHYYSESYRFYPTDLDVITWLGSYYMDCEVYEQAMFFFDRATLVDPTDVNWPLLSASCLRRCGHYQQALDMYIKIHTKYPTHVDCLRYLVRIAQDLGVKDGSVWKEKLAKLESSLEQQNGDTVSTSHASLTKETMKITSEEPNPGLSQKYQNKPSNRKKKKKRMNK